MNQENVNKLVDWIKANQNYSVGQLKQSALQGGSSEEDFNTAINIVNVPMATLKYKGVGIRFFALVIDAILFIVLFRIFTNVFSGSYVGSCKSNFNISVNQGRTSYGLCGFPLSLYFFVIFAYYVLLEWKLGGTIGKLATGIRIKKINGEALNLKESLIRNIMRIVDFLPFFYLIGAISIWSSKMKQRVGDKLAKTVVVSNQPSGSPLVANNNLPLINTEIPKQAQENSKKKMNWIATILLVIIMTIVQGVLFFLYFYYSAELAVINFGRSPGMVNWIPYIILGIVIILPFVFLRYAKRKTGSYFTLSLNTLISILIIILIGASIYNYIGLVKFGEEHVGKVSSSQVEILPNGSTTQNNQNQMITLTQPDAFNTNVIWTGGNKYVISWVSGVGEVSVSICGTPYTTPTKCISVAKNQPPGGSYTYSLPYGDSNNKLLAGVVINVTDSQNNESKEDIYISHSSILSGLGHVLYYNPLIFKNLKDLN